MGLQFKVKPMRVTIKTVQHQDNQTVVKYTWGKEPTRWDPDAILHTFEHTFDEVLDEDQALVEVKKLHRIRDPQWMIDKAKNGKI